MVHKPEQTFDIVNWRLQVELGLFFKGKISVTINITTNSLLKTITVPVFHQNQRNKLRFLMIASIDQGLHPRNLLGKSLSNINLSSGH